MLAALQLRPVDRTPVFLRDLTLGLDVCGYSTPEVCAAGPDGACYDSQKAAQCVVETQRLLGHDCVVGDIHYLGLDAERFGGEVRFPERGVPVVVTPPFASVTDALPLRLSRGHPVGKTEAMVESYRLIRASLGDTVAIAANIDGPITKAGTLWDLDALLMAMLTDPGAAHAAVDFAVALACDHAHALLQAGADFVFVAASSDSPAMVGPRNFMDHTLPGLRRLVEVAKSYQAGVVFHPHGPFTETRLHPLTEASLDTGIAGFQFAEGNDLGVATERWGERVCVLGGPDVADVILPGPAARVRQAACDAIRAAAPARGFVLMPSCSIHRGTPLAHLHALCEEARSRDTGSSRTGR
jgi:MtaA/CmuA family methyltransferase